MTIEASEDPKAKAFLALPSSSDFVRVGKVIQAAVKAARYDSVWATERDISDLSISSPYLSREIARADCIVADLTHADPRVWVEIGMARAMDKPLVLLAQARVKTPTDLSGLLIFRYEPTPPGLAALSSHLRTSLRRFLRFPRRSISFLGTAAPRPFFVDWDRLERPEVDNLIFELLAQMGYQRLTWDKTTREFDLIGELPRKDPDGFEYRELWFIATGRNAPPEMIYEMATFGSQSFIRHLLLSSEVENKSSATGELPITLLFILLKEDLPPNTLRRASRHLDRERGLASIRLRVWNRGYLTHLVQQFPQIGYKYFSDEGRSQSKYRKTPEELYRENVVLTTRQGKLIADFNDEKSRRISAERDAAWKDISFTAAHKIGNPVFAIETNLDPLKRRISDGRTKDALDIIERIRLSVERAKGIVDQFKSLTRAQTIAPKPTLLKPLLEDACQTAQAQGVTCAIECPSDLRIEADPERLAECFDELASNALHWLSKPERKINIVVNPESPNPLPASLNPDRAYTSIHFIDTGSGVERKHKAMIFDPFFTTRDQGTGLGLAVVRRIIEGHGGEILECGMPREGADFAIFLPRLALPTVISSKAVRRSKKKR